VYVSTNHDPVSGYGAVRIPLYLAWCGQRQELKPFKHFWQKNGGWQNAPSRMNLKTDEHADYDPEAGILAIRSLAYTNGEQVLYRQQQMNDYFSTSLVMLSLLAQKEHGCSFGRTGPS
jgi:endoglucanase